MYSLRRRHNGRVGVSNHQPHDCLLNRLFRRRSKKSSKLRITGLCAGNSPVTGDFPAQKVSNAENVSICGKCFHLMTSSCELSVASVHLNKYNSKCTERPFLTIRIFDTSYNMKTVLKSQRHVCKWNFLQMLSQAETFQCSKSYLCLFFRFLYNLWKQSSKIWYLNNGNTTPWLMDTCICLRMKVCCVHE